MRFTRKRSLDGQTSFCDVFPFTKYRKQNSLVDRPWPSCDRKSFNGRFHVNFFLGRIDCQKQALSQGVAMLFATLINMSLNFSNGVFSSFLLDGYGNLSHANTDRRKFFASESSDSIPV